ncbi:MAG: 3-oxoacyl-ACP reductase FabG [Candidatus Heimdallarchaeota archaeon]|nr:MAG: 3-oxoacyl-ACP reductase FabG [Candidatus Heimdallarchaeota archaeon]
MKQFGYKDYISQSKIGARFLEALREGKLEGTKCTQCSTMYYPPRANCKECLTDEFIEPAEFSGEGKILSFSEVHVPPAGFERFAPYTVAVVDLKEGGRAVAWVDDVTEPLEIGEDVIIKPEVVEGDRVTYRVLRGKEITVSAQEIVVSKEFRKKSQRLLDKVAIVTGAGKGIGREIALEYAREGAKVVVAARTQSDIDSLVEEISELGGEALAISCDVSNPDDVHRLVEGAINKFQSIDILVNNAGISRSALISKMSDDLWNSVININLTGTFNCVRAISSHFMEKRPLGGKIINFTSTAAKYGNIGQAAYAASKWGIIAFSKTAARELARYKVNVNCIMPGYIETAMTADTPSVYKEQTIAQIPQMRIGYPDDVAKVAVFLASEDSDYMTGGVVQVDGGLRM